MPGATHENASRHLTVRDAYDLWAESYDAQDNPMVLGATQILAHRLPDLAGQAVVEFGCGTGRNLLALTQAGAARVAGVDLSPGMLAQARVRVPQASLYEGDFAAAPVPARAFNVALFCLALEHAAELHGPLAAGKRALGDGGRILAIEIHPALSEGGVGAHFERDGETIRMPAFAHRMADYEEAATAAGLRRVRTKDWRPRDFARTSPRMLKRGPDANLLIELEFALA
ncbi:MAG: class I SAM-dependent DNA methyltransferase [Tagaea sp.]